MQVGKEKDKNTRTNKKKKKGVKGGAETGGPLFLHAVVLYSAVCTLYLYADKCLSHPCGLKLCHFIFSIDEERKEKTTCVFVREKHGRMFTDQAVHRLIVL